MRTPVAWLNLRHRKARTAAALTGVAMAITLIFLQIGFYRAALKSAVLILEQFKFDVAIVSAQYVILRVPGSLARSRLQQTQAVAGVLRTAPLYLGIALAQLPSRDARREVAILGIDPANAPWSSPANARAATVLSTLDTVVLDSKVGPGYASLRRGETIELDGRRVSIVGEYSHGPGFTGNAALVTSDRTFARIFGRPNRDVVSLGLVQLTAGADPNAVAAQLRKILPGDTRVLTRGELERHEQRWTMNVKPVGFMFTSGVLLAFIVGAVILYQILATEIINHLREYATLKAMGFSTFALNIIVWKQAVLYAVFGFVPAAILSTAIYMSIDATTTLPTEMTLEKLVSVFIIVTAMCLVAGTAAVRKVNRADPADLF